MTLDQLAHLQAEATRCHVDTSVQSYLVQLCERTRREPMIALGVSPRGMLIWQRVAQSWALLAGRDFVIPEDIQAVAHPVLSVRLVCRGQQPGQVIDSILSSVEVPTYR